MKYEVLQSLLEDQLLELFDYGKSLPKDREGSGLEYMLLWENTMQDNLKNQN